MSMTRTQAAAYLESQYSNLRKEILQALTDASATGYGPDIDQALRKLDVVEADLATATVEDADVRVFLALCDYYCLRRMARRAATKVDLPDTFAREGSGRESISRNVRELLKEAKATLDSMGISLGDDDAWQMIRLNLDFVEPEPTA
jgi:hypothetical protein